MVQELCAQSGINLLALLACEVSDVELNIAINTNSYVGVKMVTIKCTRKLLNLLDIPAVKRPEESDNILGDWYANLIDTYAGELVIFVNEKTLLSVAVPVDQIHDLQSWFIARVNQLLALLEISNEMINKELRSYHQLSIARTTSRKLLGSMNEITRVYQFYAERDNGQAHPNLTEVELSLSEFLHKPLNYRLPAEVARELFDQSS